MLESEKAWDVFELLEETFFRVTKLDQLAAQERELTSNGSTPNSLPPASITLTLSTAADRAPLRSIVNAWSKVSGQPHDALWPQVRAAFNLSNIKELPAEWVPDAIAWVQEKIDGLQRQLPPAAPVARIVDRQSGPIETCLEELKLELDKFGGAVQDFRQLVREIRRTASPLNAELYNRLGWDERCGVSIHNLIGCLIASACDSERYAQEAFEEAYQYVALTRTLARLCGM